MCVRLTQLEQQYATMARALDATRHDLTLKGIQPLDEGVYCSITVLYALQWSGEVHTIVCSMSW